MTSRGFGTEAAKKIAFAKVLRVAPLEVGIASLEQGIARRSKRIVAPWWVAGVLPIRMVAQPLMDRVAQRGLDAPLRGAPEEPAPLSPPHHYDMTNQLEAPGPHLATPNIGLHSFR